MGFRKGNETVMAVKEVLNEIEKMNKWTILTLDIRKCYDSIQHELIRVVLMHFLKDGIIRELLLRYYNKDRLGIYQGDSIAPIIYGMISHFIINKIEK